jgi:hypothetical protein
MPIRMVEDDNQNSADNNPGGGGGGGNRGGIGGGLIGMLLPLLFRNPKLMIPLLIIGGLFYFFFSVGDQSSSPLENQASFATGGVLDRNQFDKAAVYEPLADNTKNPLPERVSLEKYCPKRLNQGSQGSCVAWSSAYAARTILEARRTGKDPNDVAFSPSFLYNQIKLDENCQGSYIIRATENMTKQGAYPLSGFPYDENSCQRTPSNSQLQEATAYKMAGANRLTRSGDDYKIDLLAMKQNLAQGAPVIIGMMVGGSFMQDMMGKKVWIPTRNDYDMAGFGGHAMCVVGYDDYLEGGVFQIMNSWGSDWGKEGFGWVRYKDFDFFAKEAYGTYPMGAVATPEPASLAMQIALVNNETKQSIALKSLGGNQFGTSSPINIGDKFKMQVTNNKACYTYIFGGETNESSYVLFPYTPKHSPYCGIVGTRLFPKDYSMQADNKGGKDKIAIVVTTEPIDYKRLNDKINKQQGEFEKRVNTTFPNQTTVKYMNGSDIKFETTASRADAIVTLVAIEKK